MKDWAKSFSNAVSRALGNYTPTQPTNEENISPLNAPDVDEVDLKLRQSYAWVLNASSSSATVLANQNSQLATIDQTNKLAKIPRDENKSSPRTGVTYEATSSIVPILNSQTEPIPIHRLQNLNKDNEEEPTIDNLSSALCDEGDTNVFTFVKSRKRKKQGRVKLPNQSQGQPLLEGQKMFDTNNEKIKISSMQEHNIMKTCNNKLESSNMLPKHSTCINEEKGKANLLDCKLDNKNDDITSIRAKVAPLPLLLLDLITNQKNENKNEVQPLNSRTKSSDGVKDCGNEEHSCDELKFKAKRRSNRKSRKSSRSSSLVEIRLKDQDIELMSSSVKKYNNLEIMDTVTSSSGAVPKKKSKSRKGKRNENKIKRKMKLASTVQENQSTISLSNESRLTHLQNSEVASSNILLLEEEQQLKSHNINIEALHRHEHTDAEINITTSDVSSKQTKHKFNNQKKKMHKKPCMRPKKTEKQTITNALPSKNVLNCNYQNQEINKAGYNLLRSLNNDDNDPDNENIDLSNYHNSFPVIEVNQKDKMKIAENGLFSDEDNAKSFLSKLCTDDSNSKMIPMESHDSNSSDLGIPLLEEKSYLYQINSENSNKDELSFNVGICSTDNLKHTNTEQINDNNLDLNSSEESDACNSVKTVLHAAIDSEVNSDAESACIDNTHLELNIESSNVMNLNNTESKTSVPYCSATKVKQTNTLENSIGSLLDNSETNSGSCKDEQSIVAYSLLAEEELVVKGIKSESCNLNFKQNTEDCNESLLETKVVQNIGLNANSVATYSHNLDLRQREKDIIVTTLNNETVEECKENNANEVNVGQTNQTSDLSRSLFCNKKTTLQEESVIGKRMLDKINGNFLEEQEPIDLTGSCLNFDVEIVTHKTDNLKIKQKSAPNVNEVTCQIVIGNEARDTIEYNRDFLNDLEDVNVQEEISNILYNSENTNGACEQSKELSPQEFSLRGPNQTASYNNCIENKVSAKDERKNHDKCIVTRRRRTPYQLSEETDLQWEEIQKRRRRLRRSNETLQPRTRQRVRNLVDFEDSEQKRRYETFSYVQEEFSNEIKTQTNNDQFSSDRSNLHEQTLSEEIKVINTNIDKEQVEKSILGISSNENNNIVPIRRRRTQKYVDDEEGTRRRRRKQNSGSRSTDIDQISFSVSPRSRSRGQKSILVNEDKQGSSTLAQERDYLQKSGSQQDDNTLETLVKDHNEIYEFNCDLSSNLEAAETYSPLPEKELAQNSNSLISNTFMNDLYSGEKCLSLDSGLNLVGQFFILPFYEWFIAVLFFIQFKCLHHVIFPI